MLCLLVRLCVRIEAKRGGIDAVAQARRLRAIVENVPLVCSTSSAVHLRTQHKEETAVLFGLDVLMIYGRVEAWPTRSRVVLRLRAKERHAASDASIDAFLLMIPILPRKGPLGAMLSGDPVLRGGELLSPFLFGLPYFRYHDAILTWGLRPQCLWRA